jgi:Rho termination factor-like protein
LIDLRGSIMPINSRRDSDPQSDLLSTVRESQAAIVDVVRSWTDVSQRFTRSLPLPVAGVDIASFVDRVFDLAEQTLAAQRQLALALAGVATRQADTAVETIDTAVGTVETTVGVSAHPVEELVDAAEDEPAQRDRERPEQPLAAKGAARKDEPRKQDSKPDRRTYEERSIEELRDRARELEIEGRSSMSKDELVAALRKHSR